MATYPSPICKHIAKDPRVNTGQNCFKKIQHFKKNATHPRHDNASKTQQRQ